MRSRCHLQETNRQTFRFQVCVHDLAARMRPRLARRLSLSRTEGAGKAGRLMHPQPRMQNEKAHERSHYRFARTPGLPCAMVLTAYGALSPVSRAFLPPSSSAMHKHHRRLDASVEASGPHALAVRTRVVVFRRGHVHRIPTQRFVTTAKRPSCGLGRANF